MIHRTGDIVVIKDKDEYMGVHISQIMILSKDKELFIKIKNLDVLIPINYEGHAKEAFDELLNSISIDRDNK